MKIAVVLSSNRTEIGFSAKLLKGIEVLCKGRAELDSIWLNNYRIDLCDADNKCSDINCGLNDDMSILASRIVKADAIIYIPVVHAYGTCSRMQSFIERLGYGFMRPQSRPMQNKLAMVAVVGRRYSHESVYSQMILNLLLNRCIIAGSGFPATFHSEKGTPENDKEAWESLKSGLDRMVSIHQSMDVENIKLIEQDQTLAVV